MRRGSQREGRTRGAKARRPRVLGRGAALVISLLQGGCLFFGVEAQECADDREGASCEARDGDSGGTDAGGGNGSGGRIDATGGSVQGGGDSIGGTAGLGGDPSAGSGGEAPVGGSSTGGVSTGGGPGTGGQSGGGGDFGGSGGDATGGQGSGGSGQTAELAATLRINEVSHSGGGYIELYNRGDVPLDLSDIAVVTAPEGASMPDLSTVCDLSSAVEIPSMGFLLAGGGDTCPGGALCVLGCSLSVAAGAQIFLLKSIDAEYQLVSQEVYPAPLPISGQSYQAVPDGETSFRQQTATPGTTNTP